MTRLLTLGCSWMAGIGAEYDPDNPMSKEEYKQKCFDDNQWEYSFRTILSRKYGFQNVNLSAGGSSNGKQFRKLYRYLHNDTLDDTIVMVGVTSIYRMELWFSHSKMYSCFQPGQITRERIHGKNWCGPKQFFKQHFNESREKDSLAEQVWHWQHYFDLLGVPSIWFDMLNANEYPNAGLYKPLDKLPYDCNQDMHSQLAYKNGWDPHDDKYHHSNWLADCDRIEHLKKTNIVNPYSFHPNRKGHQQMADMLDPILNKCYNTFKENNPNPKPYITKWKDIH